MRKLVTLEKNIDIVYNSTIEEFLTIDNAFLPIKEKYKIIVKSNENVCKGQVILKDELNEILSPISGKVIGIAKRNVDGKTQKCLVIQNDYKEKLKNISKREIKNDKNSIIKRLYNFGFKYIASVLESKNINNLIISGINDEPYIFNNSYIVKKYYKEILDIADIFSTCFNIYNTQIVMKSNDTKNIEKLLGVIGSYPNINITLVEDKYLLANEFFMLEHLNCNQIDSLVIDAKTLMEIYNAIKYNKHTYETFITIAGNVKKSMVIKVKKGALLKEVIDNIIKINGENNLFILNGLMTGSECDINNTIITENTKGLIIIPKTDERESKCINCGMCYKICPVKVNPKKAMDQKKVSQNCIDCGLCSYICPCHINLRKFLKGEYE